MSYMKNEFGLIVVGIRITSITQPFEEMNSKKLLYVNSGGEEHSELHRPGFPVRIKLVYFINFNVNLASKGQSPRIKEIKIKAT